VGVEGPQMRLGNDVAWLDMARAGEDTWRVTADWCSRLTADFTAYLTDAEVVDFAEEMLSRLGAASGASFSAAVTPGRNNALVLKAEPTAVPRRPPFPDHPFGLCRVIVSGQRVRTPDLRIRVEVEQPRQVSPLRYTQNQSLA
jgi:hypothetical protein